MSEVKRNQKTQHKCSTTATNHRHMPFVKDKDKAIPQSSEVQWKGAKGKVHHPIRPLATYLNFFFT